MLSVNTNISSLAAKQTLQTNARGTARVMEQLSTGKRIKSSADDVAGMAISTRLTSQIRGLNQAIRNGNDAISMLQTADSATESITSMLQRMRELALKASNDTNNSNDRAFLNLEFQQLKDELNNIGKTTQWNGSDILNGTGGDGHGNYSFQLGPNTDQTISNPIRNLTLEWDPLKKLQLSTTPIQVYDISNLANNQPIWIEVTDLNAGVGFSAWSRLDLVNKYYGSAPDSIEKVGLDLASQINAKSTESPQTGKPFAAYADGKLYISNVPSTVTSLPSIRARIYDESLFYHPDLMLGGAAGSQPRLTYDFSSLNGLTLDQAWAQSRIYKSLIINDVFNISARIWETDIIYNYGTLGTIMADRLASSINNLIPGIMVDNMNLVASTNGPIINIQYSDYNNPITNNHTRLTGKVEGYTGITLPTTSINPVSNNLSLTDMPVLNNLEDLAIKTPDESNASLLTIDLDMATINSVRSNIGATISRLQFTVDNLSNTSLNAQASRSRIEDTVYSTATTELAKRNIIQQAAQAMLAQANQQPQAILQLLKSTG